MLHSLNGQQTIMWEWRAWSATPYDASERIGDVSALLGAPISTHFTEEVHYVSSEEVDLRRVTLGDGRIEWMTLRVGGAHSASCDSAAWLTLPKLRLSPLPPGTSLWSTEASRVNST